MIEKEAWRGVKSIVFRNGGVNENLK